jgi:hypothetical protein
LVRCLEQNTELQVLADTTLSAQDRVMGPPTGAPSLLTALEAPDNVEL